MRHIVNPGQTVLFDPFEHVFSPLARKSISEGWQGVFREVILELLPVETVADHFHEILGQPTKELYSMAGLVFIMQFNNWTARQAAEAYMLDLGVMYALNLCPGGQSMSSRTVERYGRIFREEELASEVFERVTTALVGALNQRLDKQRVDSTHIFSDMALFGRTQLMGVVVKRFLTQVLRHDQAAHEALPEELRARYAPSVHHLFGDTARNQEARGLLRQQVAEDMHALIRRFEDDPAHHGRTTYQNLRRVFEEQCEVVEERVKVRAKTGGRVMQNPSDPDATFDGKKGPGHQAQIAETCGEGNEVQLITAVVPQTAADSDSESVPAVREQLAHAERLPEQMLADAAYGSDANVRECLGKGVTLVSPVNTSKRDAGKLHVEAFTINPETEEVEACPRGHAPRSSVHDPETGKTRTRMDGQHCAQCPQRDQCPVKGKHERVFDHTAAERRRAQRYVEEQTPGWREGYAKRAGIEGLMHRLKQGVGLGRLRVRGRPAVDMAIYLKTAGWNILQAAKATVMRKRLAQRTGEGANTRKMTHAALLKALLYVLSFLTGTVTSRDFCQQ